LQHFVILKSFDQYTSPKLVLSIPLLMKDLFFYMFTILSNVIQKKLENRTALEINMPVITLIVRQL